MNNLPEAYNLQDVLYGVGMINCCPTKMLSPVKSVGPLNRFNGHAITLRQREQRVALLDYVELR